MKKILVFGRSCAGKSSTASLLGKKLHLPVFHMDKLFWLPGWVERPKPEMAVDVEKILVTHDEWVIDGNYKKVALESRIRAADLIIILDFNPFVCTFRALRRRLLHHNKTRPDMGQGCNEKIDIKFVKFIWNYHKRNLTQTEKVLSQYPEKTVMKFKNQRELDFWINNL